MIRKKPADLVILNQIFKSRYFFIIPLIFLFLFPEKSFSQENNLQGKDKVHSFISKGIDYLYNLDFKEAEEEFDKAIRENDKLPVGYFYKSMNCWAMIFFGYNKKAIEPFDKWISKTISIAKNCLAEECADKAETLFYLGGAYGYKGVGNIMKQEWFSAFLNARKGRKYLDEAFKLNPNQYDTYFGLGMYDYGVDKMPRVLKFFSYIFFSKGDKEKGIEELKSCIEKGKFARTEAKFQLANIYTYIEKEYDKAIPLILDLKKSYPKNPRFYYQLGIVYAKSKRWNESLKIADEIESKISDSFLYFTDEWLPKTYYLRGEVNREREYFEEAIYYYNKALNSVESKENWIKPWCKMRIGMIYDILGERELAKEEYRQVLEFKDKAREYVYAYDFAERYLKTPYNKNDPDRFD